jgi:hypothetical protein
VLLLGSEGGYYRASVPLDFQGWKLIELRPSEFDVTKVPDPATTNTLAFRAQGYGQPKLEPNATWWLKEFEVLPASGTKLDLLSYATKLDANTQEWRKAAVAGNPFVGALARKYATPVPEFQPPSGITSAWTYRSVAEDVAVAAFMASDPSSPHKGRSDLIAFVKAGLGWLVGSLDADGTWWKPKGKLDGDPNVNRFILAPVLDSLIWMRQLPTESQWTGKWDAPLQAAIQWQRRAYGGEFAGDWSGDSAGKYVNQDAYMLVIMAQSGILWRNDNDTVASRSIMLGIEKNLLPDGGFHYIGVENEAPWYHSIDLLLIARYLTLSKDPVAVRTIKATARYWPLTLTAEGVPEYWSDIWWKQTWGDIGPASLAVVASVTSDAANRNLMWSVLRRTPPDRTSLETVYAAPYWPGGETTAPAKPVALVRDRNMIGYRGQAGDWYYGVTAGRGLRNTFTGGVYSNKDWPRAIVAAFRGAQIDIVQEAAKQHGLWLSQKKDNVAFAVHPNQSAVLAVRYSPQLSLINAVPQPETPENAWEVTQLWRASGDGILGMVTAVAREKVQPVAIVGRLLLGPASVLKLNDDEWQCGKLKIHLYQSFGDITITTMAGFMNSPKWPGIEMRLPITAPVDAGTRFTYAVWVGPRSAVPPARFALLTDPMGWSASWADGRTQSAVYNPASIAATCVLPGNLSPTKAWTGESGATIKANGLGGRVKLTVPPGAAILAESPAPTSKQ